ncbi:MAG: DUF4838 domain-containing protein [Pirellulaceae bacterium]
MMRSNYIRICLCVSLTHVLGGACLAADDHTLPLAAGSRTEYLIALGPDASLPEKTAAAELAVYLKRITGAEFVTVTPAQAKGRPVIAVGPGAALERGLDAGPLGPEQWIVRSCGQDLFLVGGQPRGTLYATYHFLEDVLGVHWWTPWEETVLEQSTLQLGAIDLQGRPTFRYRDIYMLYGQDGGRFAARNRLNCDGDSAIVGEYGGTLAYGPPYHVHTFFLYFPPQEHFAAHPEWFSLIDGKRVGEGAQLCLTNPELRQAFLTKLCDYVTTSRQAARAANAPPPLVFSVSQNDWGNPCQCESCQAIAHAEGSEAGPLLEFVNFLADNIKDQYPELFIDTLAYQYTQQAPKTLKCRDNVIVRLCDTEADMLRPVTAPQNKAFHDHLLTWANVCRNLRIWDYAVTYESPDGMPLPTAHTYGPDYRFYAEHNVEGVFTELEYPLLADLRDFKVWMMMKTLENVDADYDELTNTFMDGHYGPGGKSIKSYLRALEEEARLRRSTSTCWQGSPHRLAYLNLAFVTRAHQLFDEAEQATDIDAQLLRRVRFARLPLDRATIAIYAKLVSEWLTVHGDPAGFPLDREAIAERALATWCAQIDQRVPAARRNQEKRLAEAEIRRFAMLPSSLNLPEKFQNFPRGTVYDYTAVMTRNYADVVKVVPDPEAECGITNRLDLTAADVTDPDKYVFPMAWGLYGTADKKSVGGAPVQAEDVPGPGYHWYQMGTFPVQPGFYMYFFWSWIIQLDVDNVFDPGHPDQQFEFWARIKFEGPRFPHAQTGARDAICIERIVLVRTQ